MRRALLCGLAALWGAGATAATVPDTLAQRVQACTPCHGKEGVATNQGYFPRIAGKPAGYLYNQLQNFRHGRRNNAAMQHLIDHMSDDYLREIAAHFAALALPYPPPPKVAASPQDIEHGLVLVERGDPARGLPACVQCHGLAMTGVAPAVPGLLGLSKAYLSAQFGAWRAGQRRAAAPDCMADISQRLTAHELDAVASYLARQPVPVESKPSSGAPGPLPIACGSAPK